MFFLFFTVQQATVKEDREASRREALHVMQFINRPFRLELSFNKHSYKNNNNTLTINNNESVCPSYL